MVRRAFVVVALVLLAGVAFSQTRSSSSPVQGTWRIQEVVVTGANPVTIRSPQPGLYLFTGKHYSIVAITGSGPRPKYEGSVVPIKPTDAEMIARYRQWVAFQANAGTYEIKGTTLITKALVAKNESVMADPVTNREFKVEGNTLTLTVKSDDGKSATQTKLMRLE
jgi:hypothetical protein